MQQRAGGIVTVFGILLIVGLTLVPAGHHLLRPSLCLFCGRLSGTDAVLNVLLFAPVGLGLGILGMRPVRALGLMLLLTMSIEFLQLTIIPGREASLRDILTNVVGGAAGLALGRRLPVVLVPGLRQAAALLVVWSTGWLSIQTLGSLASAPSFPHSLYYGQWQHHLRQFDRFTGRLLEAEVDGKPMADGPDPNLSPIGDVWRQHGSVRVRGVVLPGWEEPVRIAPIISIFDGHRREILLVGQWGSSLVFRVRSRASAARFRSLLFGMDDVFPTSGIAPADTALIIVELQRGFARLATSQRGSTHQRVRRIGPGLTWCYAMPFDLALGTATSIGALLWLFCGVAPLGYWSWFASRRNTGSAPSGGRATALIVLTTAVASMALWLVPYAAGTASGNAPECVATAGGIAAGWFGACILARRWSRPRLSPQQYCGANASPGNDHSG